MQGIRLSILVLTLMVTGNVPATTPSDPSVDEIIARTERTAYYLGDDGRARVTMTITDKQDRERKRRFTILRRDDQVSEDQQDSLRQKYYVHIGYPSDLRDTVLLVWKNTKVDDNRWIYLPALDLAKRIAASDKRTSFLGSDFYYEDISGRAINLDTHELIDTTENYYVIKNLPKDAGAVEFSSYTMWVHRQTYLPVKVEFKDRQDQVHRVYEAINVETIQGYPTITHSRMSDMASGQRTDLVFSRVSYDSGIEEDIFSERYLRNPPTKLLR